MYRWLPVPLPGLASIHQVCNCARAQGHGQKDIAALLLAVEAMAGTAPIAGG